MYLPALPLISKSFQVRIDQVQLTITSWLAGSMSVQLIVGPLADRYGRRLILFVGGGLFLLSSLGCTFATDISWLILARFIQGIGVCSMMVAGYASVHDLYDDKKAIHVLVWMGTAAVIAPAIGPVLGGIFLIFTSWRGIFLSLFVLGIISLLGLWFVMPESSMFQSRSSFNVKALLGVYGRIIRNGSFMMSGLAFALAYGGVIGWITASPVILMKYLHFTPFEFGLLQIPVFSGYIVGAQLVKRCLDRFSKEALILSGLLVAGLSGVLLILFALIAPNSLLSYMIPMVMYTLGFGFAAAPLNRITLTATVEQKGAAMAIFYLTMATSGTLVSLFLSIHRETMVSSCLVISSVIIASFVLNQFRRKLCKP